MDSLELENLLRSVAEGQTDVVNAAKRLRTLPFSDLGYARVDHHRELRQGMPEVVFGENKTVDQIVGIVGALDQASQDVLVTRVDDSKAHQVQLAHPSLRHNPRGRTLSRLVSSPVNPFCRPVAVVTAGTSDQGVAEEALETLRICGIAAETYYDVGVAGIHRLFEALPRIEKAAAIICIAGMEGALPSVLAGLVGVPMVAVPTSVGYGSSLSGFTPLLAMLTGCASGVTVVNIDNGFGAAMAVRRWGTSIAARTEE